MDNQHCRFCGHELKHTFADLGLCPLVGLKILQQIAIVTGYLQHLATAGQLEPGDDHIYPLKVQVCEHCFLTQAALYQQPENIFGEYQYFSSYSASWLAHCKAYVDMIVPRLKLTGGSQVLEVACNDGYLLQYFQPSGTCIRQPGGAG